tara:strand:+ start:1173 stop:1517 length:345 start_codon:yes stop_codon:yes gene_type:complete
MSIISRFTTRKIIANEDSSYKSKMRKRNVTKINHYDTAILNYPTDDEIKGLEVINVVWSRGSTYYKLAAEYYGDPELWWVIGWFNKKPIETEVQFGDIISVPLPLERVLQYYNV